MYNEGDKVKDFCLKGLSPQGEEKEYCLKDFLGKGKKVIVYFYPKDNTPGCTTEACDFRDNLNRIGDKAFVIGISPDSLASHRKFKEKYELNFPLLSDTEKKVMEDFGAYGEKKMYGKVRMGVIRSTFILDEDGTILKAMRNVRAKGHVEKILKILEEL